MAAKKKKSKAKKVATKAKAANVSAAQSKSGMSKKVRDFFEIRLDSLVVRENGANLNKASSGALLLNWIYPRPGKQQVSAIIPFSGLQDSPDGQHATLKFNEGMLVSDSFVFKEVVEGASLITAEVAITKNPGLVSKILESVAELGVKSIHMPFVGAALSVVLDRAGLTQTNARVIGRTHFEISESTKAGLYQGELIIPEPFNIYKSNKVNFRADDIEEFDPEEFKVGEFNGVLTLDIR